MSSYPLYISDDLKNVIAKLSQKKHRSMNAQILHILENWVNQQTHDPETHSAITPSNPAASVQTDAERAAALKTQGDWPDKTA